MKTATIEEINTAAKTDLTQLICRLEDYAAACLELSRVENPLENPNVMILADKVNSLTFKIINNYTAAQIGACVFEAPHITKAVNDLVDLPFPTHAEILKVAHQELKKEQDLSRRLGDELRAANNYAKSLLDRAHKAERKLEKHHSTIYKSLSDNQKQCIENIDADACVDIPTAKSMLDLGLVISNGADYVLTGLGYEVLDS